MRFLLAIFCACSLLTAGEARRPSTAAIEAWQARKFGMFIHWGLYSIAGGEWKGKRITKGYSEQIMRHAPIPRQEYAALARRFNPTQWDPEAVAKLARAAGMKFVVLTAKHHDGFNLFHTRESKYDAVDATPYGKDVVKQLAEACARNGLRFGVYYSTLDWYDERATPWDMPRVKENDNPIPPAHEAFNVAQLKELLTNYGPLTELWFDMGRPTPEQSKRFADTVHALQPDCLVSGRVFNHQGDFTVMGDNQMPDYVIDEPWQTPASMYDETWGYRAWQSRENVEEKIREHILKLVQVVSRGGNYLLNIGPRGDGSVVEFEAEILRGIGAWLQANGEAIYDAQAQPFRKLHFGYATVKPGKLYLVVREWPHDDKLQLPGLETAITRAWYLADRDKTPLPFHGNTIDVTRRRDTAPLTVVVAEYSGPLQVAPPTIKADARGVVRLQTAKADKFYNFNGRGYYDPKTIYKLQWAFEPPRAGRYRIDGKANAIAIEIDGRPVAGRETTLEQKRYSTLTVTPPKPFLKGTALPANIEEIVLTPLE